MYSVCNSHLRHTALQIICLATFVLAGCRSFDSPQVEAVVPEAVNIAIADLHAHCPEAGLDVEDDLIVGGYVTSDDRASNFYRTFTIEDASGGMEIMAGLYDLHNVYPVGYYVVAHLRGCRIAEHYGVLQAGLKPASYDSYPTDYFASRVILDAHLKCYDVSRDMAPMPLDISQLDTSLCGRLVAVGGLRCVNKELYADAWGVNTEGLWSGYNFFVLASEYDKTVNGSEVTALPVLAVYTNSYADYAESVVPSGSVTITGILQYGKAGGKDCFMIKMRDEKDCFADS